MPTRVGAAALASVAGWHEGSSGEGRRDTGLLAGSGMQSYVMVSKELSFIL